MECHFGTYQLAQREASSPLNVNITEAILFAHNPLIELKLVDFRKLIHIIYILCLHANKFYIRKICLDSEDISVSYYSVFNTFLFISGMQIAANSPVLPKTAMYAYGTL